MGHILLQDVITRRDLQRNRKVAYLFGDNNSRTGFGGQAKEMRGEPNAFGIRVKWHPDTKPFDYLSDDTLEQNCQWIIDDFHKALDYVDPEHGIIVIPSAGIGTGLAKLDIKAPLTHEFLSLMFELLVSSKENVTEAEKNLNVFVEEHNLNLERF